MSAELFTLTIILRRESDGVGRAVRTEIKLDLADKITTDGILAAALHPSLILKTLLEEGFLAEEQA